MLLTSPSYFAFLSLVFFGFWTARRHRLATLGLVLFANFFFYAKWDLRYLALIPAASTADFLIGLGLERARNETTRKALVSASVLLNTGLIATLKLQPSLLPLALSFYAFQSMTYTIDVYRRDAQAARSILAYLCASNFFPTTLAGPITRISTLLKQFENPLQAADVEGGRALFLIGLGLIKKFLIADYLAEHLVNRVFDTPKLYSGFEVLIAVYSYAMQLYYDFSGYSDIAIGSALLLGIRLPANFNRPYAAENLAVFWRRWHISLSNWLRDYLYFSLPGLRSRWKVFTYLNLIVTMTLGGLWHGFSVNFAIWGILHGIGLAAVRYTQHLRGDRQPSPARTAAVLRGLLTFHFVALAWIFFRAGTFEIARDVFAQLASGSYGAANLTAPFLVILLLAATAQFLPKNWYDSSLRLFSASPAYVQAASLALLVIAIEYVANTGAAPFIYARF